MSTKTETTEPIEVDLGELTPRRDEVQNIHEAIAAIMGHVGYVRKQRGANLNYTYAGEAALIGALRPYMWYYGVYCCVLEITDVTRETYKAGREGNTTMNNTTMNMVVRFVHSPSQTYIDVMTSGEGSDVGDKSQNKAMTGGYKYALRQTFMIETGDDPDKDPSSDYERIATGKSGGSNGNGRKPASNGSKPKATAAAENMAELEGVDMNDPKAVALASEPGSRAMITYAVSLGVGQGQESPRKIAQEWLGPVLKGLPLPIKEATKWPEYLARIETAAKAAKTG